MIILNSRVFKTGNYPRGPLRVTSQPDALAETFPGLRAATSQGAALPRIRLEADFY